MIINNTSEIYNYAKLYQAEQPNYTTDTSQTCLFPNSESNNDEEELNVSSVSFKSVLQVIGCILLSPLLLLTGCSQNTDENVSSSQIETTDIDTNSDIKKNSETKNQAEPSENGVGRFDIITDENQLLDDIKNKCENADEFLKNATQTFDMSEEELTEYITEMCNSPQFGNGCIEPIQYFALLAQESEFKNVEGDNGRAVGLGQIHEPAVEEVNYQIENNLYEDYDYNNSKTYEASDRWDAKKNVEISLLYLRYCASKTDSTEAMIAMYNTGIPDGIYTTKGFEYVNNVLGKIGKSYGY